MRKGLRTVTGLRGHGIRIGLAAAIGLVAGLLASLFAPPEVATVLGWDLAAIAYAGRIWWKLTAISPDTLQSWSADEDEGRWAITLVLAAAAAISFVAIFAMVSDKSSGWILALAGFTIVCSWTLLHTVFAAHYAHRCFANGPDKPGIDFPGDEAPRFVDFAYYAFTVGMTFQVSDTDTKTSAMRQLTVVHGLISFVFNTVIIAISVGVLSGLLQG